MSKKYLEIGVHGFNGDFYTCDGGAAFRADNLAIATKIAFNNWLSGFNPLRSECSLVSIGDGSFIVSISEDGENTRTETHVVAYYGPGDMFTAEGRHAVAMQQKWYAEKYATMEALLSADDPRVRLSKRSGLIMFTVNFPRYRENGEWWSKENSYLASGECRLISDDTTPDRSQAEEQFEYLFATDTERKQICERNYNSFRERERNMLADAGYDFPKLEQTGTCDNCGTALYNQTTPVHNHGRLMATLCCDCGSNSNIVSKFYYSKQEVLHD